MTDRGRRRLVINADDFGMTSGINRGILEAFEAGALRSASIMPVMPGFEEAADAARRAGDALGVGLHVTLTAGRPLTRCPSLVDAETGEFLSARRLLVRAYRGGVRWSDAVAECSAQLAFCRATGVRVTHVDGHHHVHAFPVIRDAVAHVARRERIRVRRRRPSEGYWIRPAGARRLPALVALGLLARTLGDEPPSLASADHFAGVALVGSARFEAELLRLLDRLPLGTTELMVHPGYVDGPLPGGDRYRAGRERELRALTAPEVLARLHRGDIDLVHFGSSVAPEVSAG
jgi:predicted glycoside hydrolase/deacetylase ChbG (UPF0249 family)